jgi:hypothetical protein
VGTFYALVAPGRALIVGKARWLAEAPTAFEGLTLLDVYLAWKDCYGAGYRSRDLVDVTRWYRDNSITRARVVSEYDEESYPRRPYTGDMGPHPYARDGITDVDDYTGFRCRGPLLLRRRALRSGSGSVMTWGEEHAQVEAPGPPPTPRGELLDLNIQSSVPDYTWGQP